MPNTLYTITNELHKVIQAKAEKFGVEIEIENNQFWYFDPTTKGTPTFAQSVKLFKHTITRRRIDVPAIQAPQIRAILLAFKEVLGSNPYHAEIKRKLDTEFGGYGYPYPEDHKFYKGGSIIDFYTNVSQKQKYFAHNPIVNASWGARYMEELNNTPKTKSEALCAKWLDGLTPLFDTSPEQVLSKLLEILKAL
jgi:hypothetical protein